MFVVSALFPSCDGSTAPTAPFPQQSPTPIPSPESKPVEVNGTRNLLFIPPILEDEDPSPTSSSFTLIAQESTKEFLQGKDTETYGYNGDYLGYTIRVNKGEQVNFKILNNLTQETTVHWHGLLVDGEMDGGPHNIILPRNEWNPNFVINQPAATLWYHAHPMHRTGGQVYRGLAGLFIIDDEESEGLNLPDDYGVNDIPLIIQDRRFAEDGTLIYKTDMMDIMQGMLGDTIIVNGTIAPLQEVSTVKTRFRILNGSNARTYELEISDGTSFIQIASDGGLLESPIEMKSLKISPGERAEIIIDFSKYSVGDIISLKSPGFNIIDFRVVKKENDATTIPEKLSVIPKIQESASVKTRTFDLMGMGLMVNINGKQMDMTRIDEIVKHGDTEIWVIRNVMGMGPGMGGNVGHPFHYHGVQFQVLSRDGRKPPLNELGWKDTILVNPNESVKVIAKFDYKGLFMYHCHILEHEDSGMMGQFEVK
jgi:FtsP/CotA-like multicopper oxidase with cupredoxin domain